MTMADTTDWSLALDTSTPSQPKATLSLSLNGGKQSPVWLKGMCYSPCPINGSNAYAPAIGDWFWDTYSGPGYKITGWKALWQRDLGNIRALGANTIRVYSVLSRKLTADGQFPSPWNSGQLMTHKDFLDECWNGGSQPLYVLAGIPMPDAMYWRDKYENASQSEITFWTEVLKETVAQLSSHPAVLGFIIQNELDSAVVTWPNPPGAPTNLKDVEFWWGQVQNFASLAKGAMGGNRKLVGMADHDAPPIPTDAQSYMATVPDLDFWGVNTYQTQNFNSIFESGGGLVGYDSVETAALKPVLLTEWGMPATGHKDPNNAGSIYADSGTIKKAADVITRVVPDAGNHALNIGIYYFEYCDEWWNQPGAPNIYTWWGGTPAPGFPNGYWDQDGFGLYSQARGSKDGKPLPNDAPIWDGSINAPAQPIDTVTARDGTVTALKTVFSGL
jgi:hypothetical protein